MTMGEKIKMHRTRLGLSQEELGSKFGVNKAAIQKWERGTVENIKRSNIKQLADLFEMSPCELMSWDEPCAVHDGLTNEIQLTKQIESKYGENANLMVQLFSELNTAGKKRAVENVKDLTAISKYTKKESGETAFKFARSEDRASPQWVEKNASFAEKLKNSKRVTSMNDA